MHAHTHMHTCTHMINYRNCRWYCICSLCCCVDIECIFSIPFQYTPASTFKPPSLPLLTFISLTGLLLPSCPICTHDFIFLSFWNGSSSLSMIFPSCSHFPTNGSIFFFIAAQYHYSCTILFLYLLLCYWTPQLVPQFS